MPKDQPRSINHALLLRHCVRSTKKHIQVCDEKVPTNQTDGRSAKLSEFISSPPLPKWNVPSLWCTERGLDAIESLGRYLAENYLVQSQHVVVNVISDDVHRDIDTSAALLRGIRESLTESAPSSSLHGLDRVQINSGVFGHSASWQEESACPSSHSLHDAYAERITDRLSLLRPTDFGVQEALEKVVSLGVSFNGTTNTTLSAEPSEDGLRCPGDVSLPLNLLEKIAEMAFYSRASNVEPPFLPSASDEDVYDLVRAADYVNTVLRLDNSDAARRGVVLAKSMLGALRRRVAVPSRAASGGVARRDEVVAINVFVGHVSNINHVATALGIRWDLPPPYARGDEDHTGKILAVPPGSGILLSSSHEAPHHGTSSTSGGDGVSMSYIVPTNLIGNNGTDGTEHQTVPIYTIDTTRPELAVRDNDDRGESSLVTLSDLDRRLEATMERYPDLRPCYIDAPIYLGSLDDFEELCGSLSSSLASSAMIVTITCVASLVAFGALVAMVRRRRASRPEAGKLFSELELSDVELT